MQSFRHVALSGLMLAWLFAAAPLLSPAALPTFRGDAEYLIDTWDSADGVPDNSALAAAQTPDGYLWFGSSLGLVRFDGVQFKLLDSAHTPSLPSGSVTVLRVDRGGRLWAGFSKGVAVMNADETWRALEVPGPVQPPFSHAVRSIAERRDGAMLITTRGGRALEWSGEKFRELPAPPGLTNAPGVGHADDAGRWWLARHDFIGRWDGARWEHVALPDWPTNVAPQEFGTGPARDGGLWLLAGRELRKYRGAEETARVLLAKLPGAFPSLFEDGRGRIWISGSSGGLWRVDTNGAARHWMPADGLAHEHTAFAFEDREQNLWAGGIRGGLQRFTERRFQNFLSVTGRLDFAYFSVAAHPTGGVFIAQYGRGLFHADDGGLKKFPLPAAMANRAVSARSLLADRAGHLWLGTVGDGVWRTDGTNTLHLAPEHSGGSSADSLFEDSRGRVWISGGRSVAMFDQGKVRNFGTNEGVPAGQVRAFAEDRAGRLWLAMNEGVFRQTDEKFTPVLDASNRAVRAVSLHAAADGAMWLGTSRSGLWRWRNGAWSHRELPAELGADGVWGFAEDEPGFLWLTTEVGVLRVRRDEFRAWMEGGSAVPKFNLFDLADGLPGLKFAGVRSSTIARDTRGRLWFATLRGVTRTDPAALRLNDVPPPVQIEGLVGHSEAARSSEPQARTEWRRPFAGKVVLPPGNRRVEIDYAAFSYRTPEKVRFQVQLGDGQGAWQDAGFRREATYYDLPPGNYVFQVRAANHDGVWNETGAKLAFTVQPFFWQTIWFRVLAALGLVAGGAGAGLWAARLQQQRRHAEHERHEAEAAARTVSGKLITAQEDERKRLARDLHDDFNQRLALLSVEMELLGQSADGGRELSHQRIEGIAGRVRDLSSEVHKLSYQLHPAKLDQLGLVAAARAFCRDLSQQSGLPVHFHHDDVPRDLNADIALCLYRVLQESLQNVVKHSSAKSAQVEVRMEPGHVRLAITDDGRGFDVERARQNSGLGLVGMRERARLVRGRIELHSTPGAGTRVELTVPLEAAA